MFEFDVPEGLLDSEVAQWVTELNQRNSLLGDTLEEEFSRNDIELPGGTADVTWPEFDGLIELTPTTLSITVESDVSVTDVSKWAVIGVAAAGVAAWVFVRATCTAGMLLSMQMPAAQVICAPMATFFSTFTMEAIALRLLNLQRDWTAWVAALGVAMVAAIGPGVWEKYLSGWVQANGPALMRALGNTLVKAGRGLWWFGSTVVNGVTWLGGFLIDNAVALAEALQRGARARWQDLRVMPLGDSITYGLESTDGNGYRRELFDKLAARLPVDFVGKVRSGTMADNQHEGHPGWRIDQIATSAVCSVDQFQPNVITLHAGTNDMNQDFNLSQAPQRLKNLISQALLDSPRAVVVVAKLIPTGKAGLQPRIDAFNAQLPRIVGELRADGKRVVLVDTDDVKVTDGLQNDSHPDDDGYDKLGRAFYDGILTAHYHGWIQDAADENPATNCDDAPGDETDSGETALGAGWRKLGVIAPGMQRPATYDRTELAEMNGDRRADYVQIRKDGTIRVAINTQDEPGQPTWLYWGGGTGILAPTGFAHPVPSDPSAPSIADEIRFADMDGDGRDDCLLVSATGKMEVFYNDGPSGFTRKAGDIAPVSNVNRDHIRFADVNGDGRDDYLRLGATGEVHAYVNYPTSLDAGATRTTAWQVRLSWAPGVNGASRFNLRFADVNDDRRADYLMVGEYGNVHAYLNKGGKDAGGFEGHHDFAHESYYPGKYVQFKDISGDGKADYLVVYREGAVRAWLNRGGNL
ncbi:FG-GAP-like repeat-containing protein [Streptosporangium vulgare]|uniref:FG-GAP-like repeat-containing protein n=1 Tax=Streptosporangium vulgare TaxID=46190 RepID=A0ABV5TTH5_9ACTN